MSNRSTLPENSPVEPAGAHLSNGDASHFAARVQAIEALLVRKGIVTPTDLQRCLDDLDRQTVRNGGRLITRAWVDPAFKERLLTDALAAARELELDATGLVGLVVLENTERVHHIVVCTLCSCSPRALLGPPPDWYKSLNYRARVVRDPRGVLREFDTIVPESVQVRVMDSTTEVRYMVLPCRPAGSDGLTEEQLAELVTWEALMGVRMISGRLHRD